MTASPTYGELTNKGASTNIAWHEASVGRDERSKQRGHRSAILWSPALRLRQEHPGPIAVNAALFERGLATYVLDGDNIRHGLCKDLGFSDADREENIRRIGEVAKLFLDAGVIVLTAFVSPFVQTGTRPGTWWRTVTSSRCSAPQTSRSANPATPKASTPRHGGADQGIHRHLQPLRSTGNARTEDRHRQAGSGRLRGAGNQSAPGAWGDSGRLRSTSPALAASARVLMQLATGTANSRPSRSPTP